MPGGVGEPDGMSGKIELLAVQRQQETAQDAVAGLKDKAPGFKPIYGCEAFYVDEDVWRGMVAGQCRTAVIQACLGLGR